MALQWQRTGGKRTERGSALIQFTVVFPVFLLMLVAIIDLCRFLAIQGILNHAASEGLNVAVKIPNLNLDVNGRALNDGDYRQFWEARWRVIEAVKRLPVNTLLTDENTESMAKLLAMVTVDSGLAVPGGYPGPELVAGASVIRPGERVKVILSDGEERWIDHLSGAEAANTRMELLVERLPLQIEVWASVEPLLPLLGRQLIRGRAIGYRENVPRGPFAELLAPDPGIPGYTPPPPTTTTTTATTNTTTTTFSGVCTVDWEKCFKDSDTFSASLCPNEQVPILGSCPCVLCGPPAPY